MAAVCRWILACSFLLLAGSRAHAAASAERNAWDAAAKAFRETIWDRAEAEFAAFAQTYTNSGRLPEAWLYQAEARLQQKNPAGALELLAAHQAQAGKFADAYLFWQAEALGQKGEHQAAAESFARLIREFPGSSNRVEASVREAIAWSKIERWPQVIAGLQDPQSPFQRAATNVLNEMVVRGFLLLGRAQLAVSNGKAAASALAPVAGISLPPELDWERHYLTSRIQLADGDAAGALQTGTNLLSLATASGQRRLQAESAAYLASLHERLGRPEDAINDYERNLAPGVAPERQREALLRISELLLRQKRVSEAAHTLEVFLTNNPPPAACADLALVTLGELRLRQFETGSCTNIVSLLVTNASGANACLVLAQTALRSFAGFYPESPLRGRADLDLGWCLWRQDDIPGSRAAFQNAVQRLPLSPEQATAYFKLAEAEYRLTNYAGAIANYNLLLENFERLPVVKTNLFEPALYHIVRAALAELKTMQSSNAGAALGASNTVPLLQASNAVARLRAEYPQGYYTDRSVLLTGQVVGERSPAEARKMFQDFLAASPDTALTAELELAIAATYEQDQNWDDAIRQYDAWLSTHTNHLLQARAEYSRAVDTFQAGRDTNALAEFTNFVARFPTDPSAQLAQWWVGDYYFRNGDYYSAEQNYQWCYQNTNWPRSSLTYEAIMMAGRAAFARQGWKDAREFYFGRVASDTNCPAVLRAQAFFALGDTLVSQASTNKLADYKEALNAYEQVSWLCPSNALAMAALGAKANCFLQCQDYAGATNAYLRVLNSALADVVARSAAKIGLGLVLEKFAQQPACTNQTGLLIAARDQYLDVFDNRGFLREGEKGDPFWTIKAGQEAARVAEAMKQPGQAKRVYEALRQQFPWLHLQEKISALESEEKQLLDRS